MDAASPNKRLCTEPVDRPEAAGPRVVSPSDLHTALRLPLPAFTTALEPIAVTAATFSACLVPEFQRGTVSYRCQIGAVRRHKRVAFFEVSILAPGESHPTDESASSVCKTQTQLVVDKAVVGDDCFQTTHSLCLGDVLDVDARWIWDPRRACPLNLAAARLAVYSRWDTEPVVALRKGGFHKFCESSHAPEQDSPPSAGADPFSGDADALGVFRRGSDDVAGGSGARRGGVIKSRRMHEDGSTGVSCREGGSSGEVAYFTGEDRASREPAAGDAEAHGSTEGAKSRARKMCAWICGKMEGSEGWMEGRVLDVAGGAGESPLDHTR